MRRKAGTSPYCPILHKAQFDAKGGNRTFAAPCIKVYCADEGGFSAHRATLGCRVHLRRYEWMIGLWVVVCAEGSNIPSRMILSSYCSAIANSADKFRDRLMLQTYSPLPTVWRGCRARASSNAFVILSVISQRPSVANVVLGYLTPPRVAHW